MLWGPSGTGKSRFVAARWPDAFWKAPESKWWDGYSGHETVVLDDFKDYGMPLVDLQRLLDWYPLWVEVRGSVPMLAKRYVITANTSPMTGTYAGTRIVPSAAVSPTSPSASADSSSARPAGSHLGPPGPGPRFRVILAQPLNLSPWVTISCLPSPIGRITK